MRIVKLLLMTLSVYLALSAPASILLMIIYILGARGGELVMALMLISIALGIVTALAGIKFSAVLNGEHNDQAHEGI